MVNIGDIARTPALLAVLEKHFGAAKITLWPFKSLSLAATTLLKTRFPNLEIVEGTLSPAGETSDLELARAVDAADFFLHGSGPAMLGWERAEAFRCRTGREFGVYGVTYGLYGIPEKATLSRARFAYFRDSVSLATALDDGVKAPLTEWSPDVAFAFDLCDDERAEAFLSAHSLKPGEFLCCIPRLRHTPFWTMRGHDTPFDAGKHARNEAMKAHDLAPLRAAIIAVTRESSMKVLICPEDESQMAIGRENVWGLLPDDVKKRVVWRESFWLPDEALSVYRRSAGVFGCEMHSPIMAVGNGIPAIVCRCAEQSSKGFMWRDIGLREWLFDLDSEADIGRIVPAVLSLVHDPVAAKIKAKAARTLVFERLEQTMSVVKQEVTATWRKRASHPYSS